MSECELKEIFIRYENLFTDLFMKMYEESGKDISGMSCERVGPDVVSTKGSKLFVSFKVW